MNRIVKVVSLDSTQDKNRNMHSLIRKVPFKVITAMLSKRQMYIQAATYTLYTYTVKFYRELLTIAVQEETVSYQPVIGHWVFKWRVNSCSAERNSAVNTYSWKLKANCFKTVEIQEELLGVNKCGVNFKGEMLIVVAKK